MSKGIVRQSAATKNAWRSGKNALGFDYAHFPELVEFINREINPNSRVILVGGTGGNIHSHIKPVRSIVSADIRKPDTRELQHVDADMEQVLPIDRLRLVGLPSLVVTPFSLEYASLEPSILNIAKLLLKGEIWIWLCHHSDGPIALYMQKAQEVLHIVNNITTPLLQSESEERVLELITALTTFVMRTTPIPGSVDEELMRQSMSSDSSSPYHLRYELLKMTAKAAMSPQSRPQALIEARTIREKAELFVDRSALLCQQNLRTPTDLEREAGDRFRLVNSDIFYAITENMPYAIGAVFEKL